jgi:hypothetical protein
MQRWRSPVLSAGAILPAFVVVMVFDWCGLVVATPAVAGGLRLHSFCGAPRCQKIGFVRSATADRAGTTTARPWHFRRRLGVRTVELAVSWTACSRQPASTVRTHLIEHPGRAVITTLVHVPARPPATPCLKQRQRRNIRVRLGAPVAQLKLYDGSYSPPKLRWPRAAI